MAFSTRWQFKVPFSSAKRLSSQARGPATDGISVLTSNAFEHLLSFLNLENIIMLSTASSDMLRACAEDGLWRALCLSRWGIAGEEALRVYGVDCFRALYAAVYSVANLEGVYCTLEDYPYGTIMILRFDNGRIVAEDLVASTLNQPGVCRLFEIQWTADSGESPLLRVKAYCYHHLRGESSSDRVNGHVAELKTIPRPRSSLKPANSFRDIVACVSGLVLSPSPGVLELTWGTDHAIAGTWWGEAEEEEEDVGVEGGPVVWAKGHVSPRLAEVLNLSRQNHHHKETSAEV